MRVGIILYSITGNTLSVGEQLMERLKSRGMDATLMEIKVLSDDPDEAIVEIIEKPDLSQFDQLVFASPVHAFNLSRVMKTYLGEIDSLDGKDCLLFVTHHFPKAWMGGNQALRQMRQRVVKKNGLVKQSFCINWSSKNRDQDIRHLLDNAFH
jgi:menaquinone-dependent protoporphyrinogen IX oxidase